MNPYFLSPPSSQATRALKLACAQKLKKYINIPFNTLYIFDWGQKLIF
jgi:hypothetical protein